MLSDEEFRRTLRRALRQRVHEGVAPQRAIGKALAAHSAAEQRAGASHFEPEEFLRELAIAEGRRQINACLWQQVEAVRGDTAAQLRLALTEPDAASRARYSAAGHLAGGPAAIGRPTERVRTCAGERLRLRG